MHSIRTSLKFCLLGNKSRCKHQRQWSSWLAINFALPHQTQTKTGAWVITLNPLLDDNILDSSKLKEFADDNFKFDENGRKLSKWVENTVGKGEIACYEQFLLFPQCFQKAFFPGAFNMQRWVLTTCKKKAKATKKKMFVFFFVNVCKFQIYNLVLNSNVVKG